jgi:hypothetical protein
MRQRTSTILIRSFAIAVLLLICVVGVMIYLGASVSLRAEKALHAINLVTIVVDEYVEKEGSWPQSWDDLTSRTDGRNYSMYAWPDDFAKIQEFVEIDFKSDPTVLASQTVDQFDAIRPIGAHYPFKVDGHVEKLLNTLRNTVGKP